MKGMWSILALAVCMLGLIGSIGRAVDDTEKPVPPPAQDPKVLALADLVKLPPGERYDVMVPDTLDLAERCRLAIHGLTFSISDPTYDYEPYYGVVYSANPPYATISGGVALTIAPKFADVLPLLRIASGSDENLDIERAFMRALLARSDPDTGLLYSTRITPLSHKDRPWHNDAYEIPPGGKRIKNQDVCDIYCQGARWIKTLISWYERSGDKRWLPLIKKTVHGVESSAIEKRDYAYYPDGGIGQPFSRLRSGWVKTDEAKIEGEGAEGSMFVWHGMNIRILARYYEMTGDKEALAQARKLANYVLKARFWGEPRRDITGKPCDPSEVNWKVSPEDWDKSVFDAPLKDDDKNNIVGRRDGHWVGHTCGHIFVMCGLLELADATQDTRLLDFVRSSYEYFVKYISLTASYGRERGNEDVLTPGYQLAPRVLGRARIGMFDESADIGLMVYFAIRLSDAGAGDYWDDVDRWTRNHLVERQFTDASLLHKVCEHYPIDLLRPELQSTGTFTSDDFIERSLGLFAIYSPLNCARMRESWLYGLIASNGSGSCNQCVGLYSAWESIVRKEGDWIRVNLLLNRASPWLDVDSYIPYEGKVVLRIKTARNVRVRLNDWIVPLPLTTKINGKTVQVTRRANQVEFVGLKPGDVVTLEFPMVQTVETMGKYTCTFRGNTLCKVEPGAPDYDYPYYQREQYLQDKAPMRRVSRYVAPRSILW